MSIKNKKFIIPIGFFFIIILFIFLVIKIFFQVEATKYVDAIPPKIPAKSPEDIGVAIIRYKPVFGGYVKVLYFEADPNKAEIDFRNDYSDDDSIGAREGKVIAEKRGPIWVITQYKVHWKCKRDFFEDSWSTNTCS